jgi:hypothetical protein
MSALQDQATQLDCYPAAALRPAHTPLHLSTGWNKRSFSGPHKLYRVDCLSEQQQIPQIKLLFITVVSRYLNFTTFSKDLLAVSYVMILACILVRRHQHMLLYALLNIFMYASFKKTPPEKVRGCVWPKSL